MAPSLCIELHAGERQQLLDIARQSIHIGLQKGDALDVAGHDLSTALTSHSGVFVTLLQAGRLRGCIGTLQASEPLAQSVANSAFGAAFQDPRFPRLQRRELHQIHIEISILSPMEPLAARNREELLDRLCPGTDGLLLEDGRDRATFLPKVWEQIPCPGTFLEQLFDKAGLAADHWSPTLCFYRYHTVCLNEAEVACKPIEGER